MPGILTMYWDELIDSEQQNSLTKINEEGGNNNAKHINDVYSRKDD